MDLSLFMGRYFRKCSFYHYPFSNLVGSTYILATEDTYGCVEKDTLILNNPLELITTANNNVVSCIDSCNSNFSVIVSSVMVLSHFSGMTQIHKLTIQLMAYVMGSMK